MNVLAFCSGSGGLELGIEIARPDARPVAYVEREAHAAATLVARMEDGSIAKAPIWSDAGTFDPRPWRGVVDCIASGDPCQPNSEAGKRLGAADDRWLIDQLLRCVDIIRPHCVFRENVPGNADGQLAALVPPLERMGYRVAAGIFAASEAWGSHIRERLFIMAWRDDFQRERKRLHARQRKEGRGASLLGRDGAELADAGDGLLPTEGRRSEGRNGPGPTGASMVDTRGPERRPCAGDDGLERQRPEEAGRPGRPSESMGGAAGGAIQALAVTDGARSSLGLLAKNGRGTVGEPRYSPGTRRDELPLFAPGPNDTAWAEYPPDFFPALSRYDRFEIALRAACIADDGGEGPWPGVVQTAFGPLHPALVQETAQRVLRGMDAGMAQRVDRLRLCGNGVFPLAASYAWCALDATLLNAQD